MSILNSANPVNAIIQGVFGKDGISGGVTTILEKAGVLKNLTPEEKQAATDSLHTWEQQMTADDNVAIQAVNTTMQAEAGSEHFLQWSWRPMFGYTACSMLLWNYMLAPLLHYPTLNVPAEVWTMILAVLGISAGTRGYEKIVAAKGDADISVQNAKNP